MSGRTHVYHVEIAWDGATTGYRDYSRDHRIAHAGAPDIPGSSDPAFRGDPARWNPEQLFLASIAACHKLWFLHLACEAGLVVTSYRDAAEGVMAEQADGGGRFVRVTLRPQVVLASGDPGLVAQVHAQAHAKCFIANSVACPIEIAAQQVQ